MKKYLIALSALAFATTSCYEKLNIAPPNAITNEMVQELLKTADEATTVTIMGAIADALPPLMYGSGYNYRFSGNIDGSWSGQLVMRTLSGNDVAYGYLSMPQDQYYNCQDFTDADNLSALSFWHRAFTLTNQANKVFNVLTEDVLAANPNNNSLKDYFARALIIRAYGYLYAMENFGTTSLGMPIYTVYSVAQTDKPRASAKETYDSIIRWASRADDLFAEAGVGFKATATSSLTRGLSCFVIARAALLAADCEGANASTYLNTASQACDRMIQGGASLMTEDQYVQKVSSYYEDAEEKQYPVYQASTSGFMNFEVNPEALYGFGWQYGGAGNEVSYNNFLTGSFRIDDRLYNMIDDKDYRKDNFHPTEGGDFYSPGNTSFIDGGSILQVSTYWTSKFANNVGIGGQVGPATVALQNRADFAFIRLSEAYLMKAECQARLGDDAGAKVTLNTLLAARAKDGETLTCDNYASMAGMSALEMVQLQTRIELWGERASEWYNNRRWNIAVNRAGSNVHWTPSITYPVSRMTCQIPSEEIGAAPNFGPQNPQ